MTRRHGSYLPTGSPSVCGSREKGCSIRLSTVFYHSSPQTTSALVKRRSFYVVVLRIPDLRNILKREECRTLEFGTG